MGKVRIAIGKFGKFWAHIVYFWLARVKQNLFENTKFSKLSKDISDPDDGRHASITDFWGLHASRTHRKKERGFPNNAVLERRISHRKWREAKQQPCNVRSGH